MIKAVVAKVNSPEVTPVAIPESAPADKSLPTAPSGLLRWRSQRRQKGVLRQDSASSNLDMKPRKITASSDDTFVSLPTLGTTEAGDYTQRPVSPLFTKEDLVKNQRAKKVRSMLFPQGKCCLIS